MFLGAGAVLNNGSVLSRAGTAVIALSASDARIPLLVCCETYKFVERLVLDSMVLNELGDPYRSLHASAPPLHCTHPQHLAPQFLSAAHSAPSIQSSKDTGRGKGGGQKEDAHHDARDPLGGAGDLRGPDGRILSKAPSLHLMYDVTPSEFVTCIVTELGLIPTTSVPVVLRRSKDDVQ